MLQCIRCSVADIAIVGCLYLTMGQHNIQILDFKQIFLWLSEVFYEMLDISAYVFTFDTFISRTGDGWLSGFAAY